MSQEIPEKRLKMINLYLPIEDKEVGKLVATLNMCFLSNEILNNLLASNDPKMSKTIEDLLKNKESLDIIYKKTLSDLFKRSRNNSAQALMIESVKTSNPDYTIESMKFKNHQFHSVLPKSQSAIIPTAKAELAVDKPVEQVKLGDMGLVIRLLQANHGKPTKAQDKAEEGVSNPDEVKYGDMSFAIKMMSDPNNEQWTGDFHP